MRSLMVVLLLASAVSAEGDWTLISTNESLDTQYAEASGMPGSKNKAHTDKDSIYVKSGDILFRAPLTWIGGAEATTGANHDAGATTIFSYLEHTGQVDTGADPQGGVIGYAKQGGQLIAKRVIRADRDGIAEGYIMTHGTRDGCAVQQGYSLDGQVWIEHADGSETPVCWIWTVRSAGDWFQQWVDDEGNFDFRDSATPTKSLTFQVPVVQGDKLIFEGAINPDEMKHFSDASFGTPTDRNPEGKVSFSVQQLISNTE